MGLHMPHMQLRCIPPPPLLPPPAVFCGGGGGRGPSPFEPQGGEANHQDSGCVFKLRPSLSAEFFQCDKQPSPFYTPVIGRTLLDCAFWHAHASVLSSLSNQPSSFRFIVRNIVCLTAHLGFLCCSVQHMCAAFELATGKNVRVCSRAWL